MCISFRLKHQTGRFTNASKTNVHSCNKNRSQNHTWAALITLLIALLLFLAAHSAKLWTHADIALKWSQTCRLCRPSCYPPFSCRQTDSAAPLVLNPTLLTQFGLQWTLLHHLGAVYSQESRRCGSTGGWALSITKWKFKFNICICLILLNWFKSTLYQCKHHAYVLLLERTGL